MEKNKVKIIALYGKAGAGKDTILNQFFQEYGDILPINKIISCTTRPPRDYEENGKDYFFLTDEEFLIKVADGTMLEATKFREWFYGTSLDTLDKNKVNIGVFNPEGIANLLETAQSSNNIEIKPVYIDVPDKIRLLRQLKREQSPDCAEICRRFFTDEKDFAEIDFEPIWICYNTTNLYGKLKTLANMVNSF